MKTKQNTSLVDLLTSNSYKTESVTCPGCTNHCTVKQFEFPNGNRYYSGNNCEKIFSNNTEVKRKGINLFLEKYNLLFNRKGLKDTGSITIGIPRALGMYENYPFWHTLFTECGFNVMLSAPSGNRLYENAIRTIMADNICFPAKLMHGHIMNLIERKPDRIFYPYVVYEQKEDKQSANSYNCPIVTGYSDVIRSAIDPAGRYGIPFDSPVISFNNNSLLKKACIGYLGTLGVKKNVAIHAIAAAQQAQSTYLEKLAELNRITLDKTISENRTAILLASRPYHIDPFIQHKIADAISDMGIDVLTENIALHDGSNVYTELNALTQWAYPNRIFKSAHYVSAHRYKNLHMVQLTSFGCGPDAFILDEVNAILYRNHKNLTILKIDDVNNIGSLRLRIRSLIESAADTCAGNATGMPHVTTKKFEPEDRQRTIIAPYFAEGYSEFLPSLFSIAGYRFVNLPTATRSDAETGLRHANNDICYPATIVIGSIINALQSGKYDLKSTAVAITQTGGQCRASNYFSLIKNAMASAGFQDIPIVSVALSGNIANNQPGFEIPWRKMARITLHTMLYADCIARLYHATAPRETICGIALHLRNLYINKAFTHIEQRDIRALQHLLAEATDAFSAIIDRTRYIPQIGLVGEIYVKYNSFSNLNVTEWLITQGVEVIPPSLVDFFSTTFVNNHINRSQNIKKISLPGRINDIIYSYISHTMHRYDRICKPFPFYCPFTDIFRNARLASQVINLAADFGEGWLLPGEICHLAESGIQNVVSLQPFGCIANHIISKGIEKRIRQVYPFLNLLFLDFDSGTSEANVFNRLHFMLKNAKRTEN